MQQRKPAPPIFDTDEPAVPISNPLPKVPPIDIKIGDSDDDSSFEEILLMPSSKPALQDISKFWELISSFGWKDKPQLTTKIRNAVSDKYAQLSEADRTAFDSHVKTLRMALDKSIKTKQLYDKFSRKLQPGEIFALLIHVIFRGKEFYESMVRDPSPIGYLVGVVDEFEMVPIYRT